MMLSRALLNQHALADLLNNASLDLSLTQRRQFVRLLGLP